MPTGQKGFQKGNNFGRNKTSFKKGFTPWNKGKKLSAEHIQKLKEAKRPMGPNSPRWKGKDVGYIGVHTWIRDNWGIAKRCEFCKKKNKKKYSWANKDHKYSRKRKDWLELCYSCHKNFDLTNNNKK